MPCMMVQSAGIRSLRREMETRRRRPELAPTGRVAEKSPKASAPRPRSSTSPPTTTPPAPCSAGAAADPRARVVLPSSADERCVILALPAPVPSRRPAAAAELPMIKKGTQVSVRTRVGEVSSGVHLVLSLDAVVVSDEEDGFLDVVYKAKFPLDDPFRPVRVATDKVMVIPPAAPSIASTTTTKAAAPRCSKSADKGGARPATVAGK
ncbi:uncharacterized protein LOC121054995 [Oryza brachyantha]|uniref:uncharacterized protein LOC121054995 n=1 Tax=Oryza brachyantha TaxID=4533 RepID=UPI001ADAA7C0|nr:uncharacterized protein LOC121054995 [Oryza brachyantha]